MNEQDVILPSLYKKPTKPLKEKRDTLFMEKNIVRSIRVNELLNDMMKADMKLYEQILDTPGFAYAFNELCKKAQEERIIPQPAPPSSPTATAEDGNIVSGQMIKGVVYKDGNSEDQIKLMYQKYSTCQCMSCERTIIQIATEYASLKEREAHNRAVQGCIGAINTLISKRFGLTVNNQLYYLESDEVLKELEKLK